MIVIVRISTPYPLRKARSEIEREKEDPPPLILTHVRVLVRTMCPECDMIQSEYHMAKGDRLESHPRRQHAHEGRQFPPSHFDDTINDTDGCAEVESDQPHQEADTRCGCC